MLLLSNHASSHLPARTPEEVAAPGALRTQYQRSTRDTLAQIINGVWQEIARYGPVEVLKVWQFRRHFRGELQRLLAVGPHMIADVGLTLENAREDVARPFWQG